MSRLAWFSVLLAACELHGAPPPTVTLHFPEAEGADGVIPYRARGPFAVRVEGNVAELGRISHATVEIVTGTIPADAVVLTTATLTDQGDGTLAGTATLGWPPGGSREGEPLAVRALVGEPTAPVSVPLEVPVLSYVEGPLTTNGIQRVRRVCFASTSTDGTLVLHLSGAKLPGGTTDGVASLVPGDCATGALDPRNPSSHARVDAVVTAAAVQIVATLQGTPAVTMYKMLTPPAEMLRLQLDTASTTPPRGSLVEVDVDATANDEPAADIAVTFHSIPTIPLVPGSLVTGADGAGVVRFQMPAEGSIAIIATSGATSSDPLVFH